MSAGRPVAATIRPTGEGRWTFSVPARRGSTPRVRYTCRSEAAARTARALVLAELDAGRPAPDPGTLPADLTGACQPTTAPATAFEQVAYDYLTETYVLLKRASPTRHQRLHGFVRTHLSPFMTAHGFTAGSDLTREAYVRFVAAVFTGAPCPGIPTPWTTGSGELPPGVDPGEEWTVDQAAAFIGCTPGTVHRYARRGLLPGARMVDGRRMVPVSDLADAGLLGGVPGAGLRRGPRPGSSGLAPDYASDIRRLMDAVLAYGVDNAGWRLAFTPSTVPNGRNLDHCPRKAVLSVADCFAMASYLHPVHQVVMWITRLLALRISETYGLCVHDLVDDGDRGLVRIHRQGGRTMLDREPGTGRYAAATSSAKLKTTSSYRVLVVPRPLMDLLRVVIEIFHTDLDGTVRQYARLVPGLKRADESGQVAFRDALRTAALAAGVDVSDGWDPDAALLLPVPKDMRAGAITDMAWMDLPEVARKRFAGHLPGNDVHHRSYVLDSPALAPLVPAAEAMEHIVSADCPGGLMVPTTLSCTTTSQMHLHARRDRLDSALVAVGWYANPVTADGHTALTALQAADELGVSTRTVRQWVRAGRLAHGGVDRGGRVVVPLTSVLAVKEQFAQRRLLVDVAADLGVDYHHLYYLLRRDQLAVEQDGPRTDLLVTPATEERLRTLVIAEQDLDRRAMTVMEAAVTLQLTERVVNGLIAAGTLTVDRERGLRGARMVTRASVERHQNRTQTRT
jgi:hypothetical protein